MNAGELELRRRVDMQESSHCSVQGLRGLGGSDMRRVRQPHSKPSRRCPASWTEEKSARLAADLPTVWPMRKKGDDHQQEISGWRMRACRASALPGPADCGVLFVSLTQLLEMTGSVGLAENDTRGQASLISMMKLWGWGRA
jgi:hypothetical protein